MKTYETSPDEPDRTRLFVDVADYEVVDDGTTLVVYGFGACVALAVYDPENGVGGLACSMLPRRSDGDGTSEGKFVDAAVETMLREVVSAGASFAACEGYIVGGADLLDLEALPREVSERNVAVAREEFAELDVPVEGTAVGGQRGRTVEFDTATGELRVITARDPDPTVLRPAQG